MLLKTNAADFPRFGARMRSTGLLHSKFRVWMAKRSGITSDGAMYESRLRRPGSRCLLIVQLEGEARWYLGARPVYMRPGDFVLTTWGEMMGHRHQARQHCLAIDWEPGSLGTRTIRAPHPLSLSPWALAGLRQEADRLHGERDGAPEEGLARILAILRAEGLPFDPFEAGELQEEVPERLSLLSRALDRSFSSLGDAPAMIDLEASLGWTRQRIHTVMKEFAQRYPSKSGSSWRAQILHWRLLIGAWLMSVPTATTEEVAVQLGYSTPANFCNAFANAGFPSPGNIRAELRRLA